MIAYEIIKLTFGQPFNRYAWMLNPPNELTNCQDAIPLD
jgi:hypothetical protein